eukprot:1657880-Pleurochrysis_carterae.AAC.1
MRRPCPDQKIRARLTHSSSGPCPYFQLGSICWPLSLSDREIRAPLPEGPSTHRSSLPAGGRPERATLQVCQPCPYQKVWAQSTPPPCRPCL